MNLLRVRPGVLQELASIQTALRRRYAVEREIGRGGMATVYLAVDRKHDRKVAIKVLAPELALALGPDRFLREIEVAARLSHPHILPLHDSGQSSGLLYYVMPFVEGESLRERLRRERQLPLNDAVRIASEVADALSYAHERAVVHRDVKPENILLTGGHALLTDFGVAHAVTVAGDAKLTDTGLAIGTAAYMSPEQATGSKQVDGRSDVYSLGCVLYEMLAGEAPHGGSTPVEMLAKRFSQPPPKLRALRNAVPEWLEQTVRKTLERSPADRFATAAEVREALTEGRLPAGRVLLGGARRPLRRRVVWAASAVIGLTVLLTVGILLPTRSASLDPKRVLVMVFQNETGDPGLDPLSDIAGDYIARGLAETGLVQVLDSRNEVGSDSAGALSASVGARDLARGLGAGTVLRGRFYLQGDSLQFESQVVDARTGEVLRAIAPAIVSAGEKTRGVELLRQRVMAGFATLFDPQFVRYEAASRPPTYEAYQEVLLADDLFWQKCDECAWRAVKHLERAIALDSTYTLAQTSLAAMSVLIGDCARTDSIAARLAPVHERLPAYDRAQLDASTAACRADWSAALEASRKAMAAEPRRAGMSTWVPFFALLLNRPREALSVLPTLDGKRFPHGTTDYYWHWARSYHSLGEYGKELIAAQRARRMDPEDMFALQNEVVALAALGRVREVEKRIEERLEYPVDLWRTDSPGRLMVRAGLELRAHGRPEAARLLFERAIAWYRERGAEQDFEWEAIELAYALYFAERWNQAHELFAAIAARDTMHVAARGALGALAARRGDRAEAARIETWLATHREGEPQPYSVYRRATIAALLGEDERAVGLLREAVEEGLAWVSPRYFVWLEVDPDLEPLRDYPPFRQFVRPRG